MPEKLRHTMKASKFYIIVFNWTQIDSRSDGSTIFDATPQKNGLKFHVFKDNK